MSTRCKLNLLVGLLLLISGVLLVLVYRQHRASSAVVLFPVATLEVTLSSSANGAAYSLTIAVQGSRAYTMPVRFTRGAHEVDVTTAQAEALMTRWVKSLAADVGRLSAMPANGSPTLYLDVTGHAQ